MKQQRGFLLPLLAATLLLGIHAGMSAAAKPQEKNQKATSHEKTEKHKSARQKAGVTMESSSHKEITVKSEKKAKKEASTKKEETHRKKEATELPSSPAREKTATKSETSAKKKKHAQSSTEEGHNGATNVTMMGKKNHEQQTAPHVATKSVESSSAPAVGKTADGKLVYEGGRGGHYDLNGANKVYVKDFVGAKIIGKTEKGEPIYEGQRGGHFYYSASGNKVYV